MSATRKKSRPVDKDKKKISSQSKAKGKLKLGDAVCVIDDIVLAEQVYCCDDECCCPI